MSQNLMRLTLLAALGAGLIFAAPAKFLEDEPAGEAAVTESATPDLPPQPLPPGAGRPGQPLRNQPPREQQFPAGQPLQAPPQQPPQDPFALDEKALNHLIEIEKSLEEVDARRKQLAQELETAKAAAGDAASIKPENEKLVRETTAKLHETIEKRRGLVGQKMRIYMRGAAAAPGFETLLNDEVTRLEQESAGAGEDAPRLQRASAERLRLVRSLQGDLTYLRDNPEAMERWKTNMDGGGTGMAAGPAGSGRPAGPPGIGSEPFDMPIRMGWRQRAQGSGAAVQPGSPANPQAVEQRLQRLERELNFLRAQADRIEREIDILRNWSARQTKDSPPPRETQTMIETVE